MIVVSNRGPFQFAKRPDGTFAAHRGSGGVVSALMPLLANREDATWVAAAIGPDDHAAVEAGTPMPEGGVRARLLPLDPQVSRLHYDVVSNGVLWFLHHGLFDLTRRPRFDRRFREAWEGYVSVNRSFTDAVVDVAGPGETVLVQDYQLTLVPEMLGTARPDLHVVHFTHTPFCGPSSMRVLPEYVGPRDLRVDGRHHDRVPHRALGPGVPRVGGRGARRGRRRRSDVRGVVRPRPRDPRGRGRDTRGRARRSPRWAHASATAD